MMTPRQKWLLGGGVVAAVLGAGYYLGRRRNLGSLGWDPVAYTKDYFTAQGYAAAQVAQAEAGNRISNWRDAKGSAYMVNASSTNAEAYAKAAYWLAVAARIVGDRGLGARAATYLAKAGATFAAPTSSAWSGDIEQIMFDARGYLPSSTNKEVKSISVIMARHAETAVVQTRKDQKRSFVDDLVDATKKTGEDVGGKIRDPLGLQAAPWWKKWAWGLGIGVAGLLALRFAFSREYHAVGRLLEKSPEPKQIETKPA